jgi:Xaa-Pro dipeptidase
MAARQSIRAGKRGGDIYARAEEAIRSVPEPDRVHFVAHGMGLVNHEAPRLTDRGPVRYPATHVDEPLEVGMVLSVETTLAHARRGLIKLEDTIAVTSGGLEAFGDRPRGWLQGANE